MKIGDRVTHKTNEWTGRIVKLFPQSVLVDRDRDAPIYATYGELELSGPKPEPVTKASLLDAAKAAVADRGLNYGKPEDNFLRIARLWGMHLMNRYAPGGLASECRIPKLDAEDVAMMMVLMKVARLENDPKHLDSWTDLAGYAACGAEITNG